MLTKHFIQSKWRDLHFSGAFSGLDTFYYELKHHFRNVPSKALVNAYLADIPTYQIHAPYSSHYETRHLTNVTGVGLQLQGDLAFMPECDGFKGFLLCVDELNHFLYTQPFQTKSEQSMVACFTHIFSLPSLKNVTTLSTDKGSEFLSAKKHFHRLTWFFLTNKHKAFLAEHYIKVVKGKLYRCMRENRSDDWVSILSSTIDSINNTQSKRLGMSPSECNDPVFDPYLRSRVTPGDDSNCRAKFRVGQPVFKALPKDLLFKGFDTQSGMIYRVDHVDTSSCPFKYFLRTLDNRQVGWVYDAQLKAAPNPDTYEFPIEKVIDKRTVGGQIEYFVKWLYYPNR